MTSSDLIHDYINPQLTPLPDTEYTGDSSGCILHKRARIQGNVSVQKHCLFSRACLIRGEYSKVSFKSLVFVGEDVVVKPPLFAKDANFSLESFPVRIGECVILEKGAVCEAATISDFVWVGPNCVIGARAFIGVCVLLTEGTVVPPGTQLGSYGIYKGNPAKRVGELDMETSDFDFREAVTKRMMGYVLTASSPSPTK